jgi:hypothetical protein
MHNYHHKRLIYISVLLLAFSANYLTEGRIFAGEPAYVPCSIDEPRVIQGQVFGEGGRPLAGAEITVSSIRAARWVDKAPVLMRIITDDHGNYNFLFHPRKLGSLLTWAPGYAYSHNLIPDCDDLSPVNIQLSRPASVLLTLKNCADKNIVVVDHFEFFYQFSLDETCSTFVDGVNPGYLFVYASPDGIEAVGSKHDVDLLVGDNGRITMSAWGTTLQGDVWQCEQPVANKKVYVSNSGPGFSSYSKDTDENGAFHLRELKDGNWTVGVVAQGVDYEKHVEVIKGKTAIVRLEIPCSKKKY